MIDTIINAIETQKANCHDSTSMALELICEDLYYNHNIDARYHGRSIYVDGKRVASIKTCVEPCEDARIIAIYDYTILIKE